MLGGCFKRTAFPEKGKANVENNNVWGGAVRLCVCVCVHASLRDCVPACQRICLRACLSLPICLSVSQCLYVSLTSYLSDVVSLCLSVSLCFLVARSVCHSAFLSLSHFVTLYLSCSTHACPTVVLLSRVPQSFCLPVSLFLCLSVSFSFCICVSLPLCLCVSLSTWLANLADLHPTSPIATASPRSAQRMSSCQSMLAERKASRSSLLATLRGETLPGVKGEWGIHQAHCVCMCVCVVWRSCV